MLGIAHHLILNKDFIDSLVQLPFCCLWLSIYACVCLSAGFWQQRKNPVRELSVISYHCGYIKRYLSPEFVRVFTFNCVHLEKETYATTQFLCSWGFLCAGTTSFEDCIYIKANESKIILSENWHSNESTFGCCKQCGFHLDKSPTSFLVDLAL